MKIAIDISQTAYEGTGVSRYMYNLVASLMQYDKNNLYLFFFSSLRRKMSAPLTSFIKNPHSLKQFPFPPTLLDLIWNRFHVFSIDNLIGKQDVLLTSDWTEPPSSSKKITVVHDLVFLKFPETLPQRIINVQKRRLRWVKKESTLIIADSRSTKQDLIELLHIQDKRIEVIYPAITTISPDQKTIKETRHRYTLNQPFILTVGKQEPRKNISRLISAFKNAKLTGVDLVIAGPKGWGDSHQETDNVRYLGYMTEKELSALYSSAHFFVYPSLYEGFGYPVAEAMSLGCPVATSNTSSLKEIAENASLLFNPYHKESIAQSLIDLHNNPQLRNELKEKGLKRSLQFSHRRFARELLPVFEKAYDYRR